MVEFGLVFNAIIIGIGCVLTGPFEKWREIKIHDNKPTVQRIGWGNS